MKIEDIYRKFGVPPNLQEHMMCVTGVTSFIEGHWKNKDNEIDWDLAKKIALLHDLGNVVKFDLDRHLDFLGTGEESNIDYWRGMQKKIIDTYGTDDHEVTKKMLQEIIVSQEAIDLIQSKGFGNSVATKNSDSWLLKILFYADMRTLPKGIGTLQERVADIRGRMPKYSSRSDFEDLVSACQEIERQIQINIDISVLDINSRSVEVNKNSLLAIDVSRRLLNVLFDSIGRTYGLTRKADPRIVEKLIKFLDLPSGSTVADIGAGTGNYSAALAEAGYKVIAVEPSVVMRSHGKQRVGLEWKDGWAEDLPLGDSSVNGIICTAAIHHFYNLSKAIFEMVRVLKPNGKVVIFNVKHANRRNIWIDDYFNPESTNKYPSAQMLAKKLGTDLLSECKIAPFPIPYDINDMFFISGWRRPWLYLDETFCENISPLAKAPKEKLRAFQDKLRSDLLSGRWLEKYGDFMTKDTINAGYFFVFGQKHIV